MPRNRWPSRPLDERFWEKVEKGSDCWVWIGAVSAPGQHGRIWVAEERRKVIASRVSWTMHRGPIPEGMEGVPHLRQPSVREPGSPVPRPAPREHARCVTPPIRRAKYLTLGA